MKRLILICSVLPVVIAAAGVLFAADAPRRSAQIQVLLITGDDVSAHPWRVMSETTRKALVESKRFDVRVCEDPHILESETALKRYDVIVFMIYSQRIKMLPGQAQENLLNFVKSGKGFFVQHLASASFAQWEEFGKLCGRKWLVEAYSDWSKKTEPLVFTLNYGKGRTVHNAFGHDGKALTNPSVQKIIVRGVEWAATGKVKQ